MGTKRDIVILSSQYWDDSWFRKHQFAVRFARDGHRVFYVEPSHSLVRRAHVAGVGKNPVWGIRSRRTSHGVTVLTPGRLLPKPNLPSISRINAYWTWRRVRRALRSLDSCDPLVIVYDVRLASALSAEIAHDRVVVDLVDDLADYPGSPAARAYMASCIQKMCDQAVRIAFTSQRLADIYGAKSHFAVIPNGFDATLFNETATPAQLDGDPPYVGFIGTLFSFLDYSLFAAVADEIPECTLVLVGRIENTASEVADLTRRDNVIHLGYLPKDSIPALVAACDVCIAPFAAGQVADAVSPLKIYEYLAMRKPVVATPLAGVKQDAIGPYVAFAATREAFVAAVTASLARGTLADPGLDAVIGEYTWDALYGRLVALLGQELLER